MFTPNNKLNDSEKYFLMGYGLSERNMAKTSIVFSLAILDSQCTDKDLKKLAFMMGDSAVIKLGSMNNTDEKYPDIYYKMGGDLIHVDLAHLETYNNHRKSINWKQPMESSENLYQASLSKLGVA